MPLAVLDRMSRSVTGSFSVPNGGGFTSQSSADLTIFCGGVLFNIYSWSGMGYGWGSGGSPYAGCGIQHMDAFLADGFAVQRGSSTFITGSYGVTCEMELVLVTAGKTVPPDYVPADLFPDYGGYRAYEHPEINAKLYWRAVPNSTQKVWLEADGKRAEITLPSGDPWYAEPIPITGVYVDMSVIDDSWFDSGGVPCTVSWGGVPIEGETRWREFYGRHDGQPTAPEVLGAKVELGTGFARVMNRGWIRSSVFEATRFGLAGYLGIPRTATVRLDAMAFDHPHPHDCEWKVITEWLKVENAQFVCPPQPVIKTLRGQSVSIDIDQQNSMITYGGYNKSITRIESSPNWSPINDVDCGGAVYWNYPHYEDNTGPVLAWIVPPPGEDPKDWRVGFRGKEYNAFKVSLKDAQALPLPSWTTNGNTHTGTWGSPQWLEGYRYMRVRGPAELTEIRIGGKSWSVSGADDVNGATIDLCLPTNGSAASDSEYTRWPLERETLRPQNQNGTPLWGVNETSSIVAIGARPTSLELFQLENFSTHALAPFNDEHEWKQPDHFENTGGSSGEWDVYYYVQRALICETDGRQNAEAFHIIHTVNTAPGRRYQDDYYPQSIQGVVGQLSSLPWLDVDESASFPDDYHNNSAPAWFLAQGYTRSGSQWRKNWDIGEGGWVRAQPVWDSMEWYDTVQNVFNMGGASHRLQLVGRKVFRGAPYGFMWNPPLTARVKNKGNNTKRDFPTDEQTGYYFAGPTLSQPNDYGRVLSVRDANTADEQESPTVVTANGLQRLIQRICIRFIKQSGRAIHACECQPMGQLALAYAQGEKTKVARFYPADSWESREEWDVLDFPAKWLQIGQLHSHDLSLVYEYEGVVYQRYSSDWGETFPSSSEMTIGSGKRPAYAVDQTKTMQFCALLSGSEWRIFRMIDEGAGWENVAKIVNADDEDEAGALEVARDAANLLTFVRQKSDGSVLRYTSSDFGEHWEA